MTGRETVCRGLSHAAWGYLFLNLDINLGSVSVLPRFVGYLLFLSAIKALEAERRDLALLRPLALFLAVWCGGDWLLSWTGGDIDGHVLFLDILTGVAGIYFQFQFLTDLAALAAAYQPPGETLDRQILLYRTVETVLVTALSFTAYLPEGTVLEVLTVLVGVVYVLTGLYLMLALFTLRKLFRAGPA